MTASLIRPMPGFTPQVGVLLSMMQKTRKRTKERAAGLASAQLDWRIDRKANSIGMLLGHIAALEEVNVIAHLEGRNPTAEESLFLQPRLMLGDEGFEAMRGAGLIDYLRNLDRVRNRTIAQMKKIDDEALNAVWRQRRRKTNLHYILFHLMEDELRHTGQITWLLKRLPSNLD